MKPAPFDYCAPETVEEVLAVLAERGDDAKLLAGGQSLLPLLSLRLARPAAVVDLSRIDSHADVSLHDGMLRIGALTRQRAAERSATVSTGAPLLAEAIPLIGHTAIRNRGTVGGSVSHADPAAELPAATLALGANFVARSVRGDRTVAAGDFFLSYLTTALEPDELLTEVIIPAARPGTGSAFVEFSRRHGDFALVGVAAVLSLDASGSISAAGLALSGVDSTPVRADDAIALMQGNPPSAELWDSAAAAVSAAVTPPDDLHGSSAYRRHLAGVLTRQALRTAAERAEGSR